MNELAVMYFANKIRWNVYVEDPLTYPLQFSPGWAFINPSVYHSLLGGHENDNTFFIMDGIDDRVFVLTQSLRFLVPFKEFPRDDALENVSRFLTGLRYVSKQVGVPADLGDLLGFNEVDQLPPVAFPERPAANVNRVVVRKYYIDTAITHENLRIVTENCESLVSPTYDTIMLDAINAFLAKDFKKTILYSAMSAEIIAATKLDEAYEKYIRGMGDSSEIRLVSGSLVDGKSSLIDPVYKYLSARTNFSTLLHERPLYLLNRSLLLDDQKLYQKALKLYRTRNKIVHSGAPPVGDSLSLFSLNETDALEAIECATEIFRWFGEIANYVIPRNEYYEGHIIFFKKAT